MEILSPSGTATNFRANERMQLRNSDKSASCRKGIACPRCCRLHCAYYEWLYYTACMLFEADTRFHRASRHWKARDVAYRRASGALHAICSAGRRAGWCMQNAGQRALPVRAECRLCHVLKWSVRVDEIAEQNRRELLSTGNVVPVLFLRQWVCTEWDAQTTVDITHTHCMPSKLSIGRQLWPNKSDRDRWVLRRCTCV